MRVLLFGANGQVGREIVRCAGAAGAQVLAIDRAMCDLAAPGGAARLIEANTPAAVINAAAYTAVDKAESEPESAHALNAAAPGEMAAACARLAIPLIHFSTDYVFDGLGRRPYIESDEASPLGVYGRTKLDGENAVIAAGGAHAILRLSWVFSPHGSNFVKTMLRLGGERDTVRIVADQQGKPTPATSAAAAALVVSRALMDNPMLSGVYHFAGDEETTWADFAAEVFSAAGMAVGVERIATADYPTPARRPIYSVLDAGRIEQTFGLAAPSWKEGLRAVIHELDAQREGENLR